MCIRLLGCIFWGAFESELLALVLATVDGAFGGASAVELDEGGC